MFSAAKSGAASSGYNLNNSLRFRASASAKLTRTPVTSGNRTTWTWSAWIKRGSLGSLQVMFWAGYTNGTQADGLVSLYFTASDQIAHYVNETGVADCNNISTAVFRDPSAWYHVVFIYDSTNATASNRQRIYVNGVQITSFSSSTYVSQNFQADVNSNSFQHGMGIYGFNNTRYFDGYMSEVNFIDGQALTPSSFGSTNATTNVWQPTKYTGTYGTNGFYLNFNSIALTSGSNTGLGKDNSGNGNYYNTTNISVTAGSTYDAMTDVPTLTSATVANYAVMNPLTNLSSLTVSNANLNVSVGNGSSWKSVVGTMALPSTGKWYWEVTVVTGTGSSQEIVGVANTVDNISASYSGSTANTYGYQSNASKNNNGGGTSYGASYTTGDVIGVAVDTTAGTIVFYKNNTSQGTAFTGLSSSYSYVAASSLLGTTSNFATNFGQRPFAYTPPTGYVALNTYNLPDSTIVKGNTVMDATLYTGNLTGQSITNTASFKPDLVWIKSRSAATDNKLTDSVRGATKALISNTTGAETTDLTGLTAFNSNGFTVGASTTYNNTSATYVGWQWQAGQGSTSSNTSGNITSTVSVNTTAGFSIITFNSGTAGNKTVGHGLGVKPAMFILKNKDSGAGNWQTWHQSFSNQAQNYLSLNTTNAVGTDSQFWANAAPTTAVLSFESAYTFLASNNIVGYCWAEIAGYSKAFSYTGNGSTDGIFVYTGFLPRFVLIKRTDTTGDWYMWDTARNTYDVINNILLANSSAAETSATSIDALSNGFKLRNTTAGFNASAGIYIGMAWATNPFKNSNAF